MEGFVEGIIERAKKSKVFKRNKKYLEVSILSALLYLFVFIRKLVYLFRFLRRSYTNHRNITGYL